MRNFMTDSEILAASKLDEIATSKAHALGEKIAKYSDLVVDTVRVVVCELAFRWYLPFALKFQVGDHNALRQLLDDCWQSVNGKKSFPLPDFVQDQLDDAAIDTDDWDHPSAVDAVAALCVIDSSIGRSSKSLDHVVALINGLELLFRSDVKQMIDSCAASDALLENVACSVQAGTTLIPIEEDLEKVLEMAEKFGSDPSQFVSLVRQSLTKSKGSGSNGTYLSHK